MLLTPPQFRLFADEIRARKQGNLREGFEDLAPRFGLTPRQLSSIYYKHIYKQDVGRRIIPSLSGTDGLNQKNRKRSHVDPTIWGSGPSRGGNGGGPTTSALHGLRSRL